jgi:hypothetical protein
VETLRVSKIYVYIGLISAVFAVAYASPLVLGPLVNPNGHNIVNNGPGGILTDYAIWPAMWMVVGYTIFLIAGVVGSFVWALSYFLVANVFNRTTTNGPLAFLQIVLFTVGVYAATALMAYVGYVEGGKIAEGVAVTIASQLGRWTVYPTGISVSMALLGVLIGVLNIFITIRPRKKA